MDTFLSGTLLAAIALGLLYGLVALAVFVVERVASGRVKMRATDLPPVTVFKPLKGVDDQLPENLQSFFELDYPQYELIFGVEDKNDPALAIVRKLAQEYPGVRCQIVVSRDSVGLNPKVNNLHNMYPYARYDHFVISDSNVRVDRAYLRDVVGHLSANGVGLVTSVIRARGAASLGAALENIHLNSFIATSVIAAKRLIGMPIAIGKSMCLRRDTLERLGGFVMLANHLAEDHILSQGVRSLGLEVRISLHPVNSICRSWNTVKFANRHLRWATIRRHASPGTYYTEILSNPIFLALIYWVWQREMTAFLVVLGVCALKTILDMGAALALGAGRSWFHYFLIPLKDVVIAALWFVPFVRRTVDWRGNRMLIAADTKLNPIPPRTTPVWTLSRVFGGHWEKWMAEEAHGRLRRFTRFAQMVGRLSLYGLGRLLTRSNRA